MTHKHRSDSLDGWRCAPRGFSLIEVMVAVVIIGILVVLAYPSYAEHVRRSQRADAQTVLLEAAQYMQRYYAARNSYAGATLPEGYRFAPKDSSATTRHYDLAVTVDPVRQSFTLTATPVSADLKCGTLTLTDTAKKGVKAASSTVAECWR